jgi:Predicted membrane protein
LTLSGKNNNERFNVEGGYSMHSIIKCLELLLTNIVEICTILLELFGVAILVFTAVKCFWYWIKHDARIRLDLAQGIALSLEFKMGSEVLRTVIVREWGELGILGVIILLRGILTFLIHWEIKHEEKALAMDKEEELKN